MENNALPFLKFEPKEFILMSMHLSNEEKGMLISLFSAQWINKNTIPKDHIIAYTGKEFNELPKRLLTFFKDNGESLASPFISEKYKAAEVIVTTNRENGLKGGRPPVNKTTKKEPNKPKQNRTVNPIKTERLTESKPKQNLYASNISISNTLNSNLFSLLLSFLTEQLEINLGNLWKGKKLVASLSNGLKGSWDSSPLAYKQDYAFCITQTNQGKALLIFEQSPMSGKGNLVSMMQEQFECEVCFIIPQGAKGKITRRDLALDVDHVNQVTPEEDYILPKDLASEEAWLEKVCMDLTITPGTLNTHLTAFITRETASRESGVSVNRKEFMRHFVNYLLQKIKQDTTAPAKGVMASMQELYGELKVVQPVANAKSLGA